jgi:hypothetical protein
MRQQGRKYLIRSADQVTRVCEQLTIGEVSQATVTTRNEFHHPLISCARLHVLIVHPQISPSSRRTGEAFGFEMDFESTHTRNASHDTV